jgi:hypothetical protein
MFHARAKFNTPGCNSSLIIAVQPEAEGNFGTAAMLLFYIEQIPILIHHTSFQSPKLSGTIVNPNSQISPSVMLIFVRS